MANISVTYTFSNGTTADATEVNTNFTDIINGTSDGTKDFSINALTCAGTATLNGAVNLGNATTDDITFNGLVASNIIPKTAAASDLGSSSLPWQSIYLDNGATDGGAIYFDAGTTEYLKATADGTELDMGGFSYFDLNGALVKTPGLYYSAKSADYTVLDTDGIAVILMTTGSTDRTITLPTAADNAGRILEIKKVDSGTGKVTVDGEGSETIDGLTTIDLLSQFSFIEIISDGTSWHILKLKDSGSYTATITNVSFTSVTSPSDAIIYVRDNMVVSCTGRLTADPTNSAGLNRLRISLPFSSNFTSTDDCSGNGTTNYTTSGRITNVFNVRADTTNDEAEVYMENSDAAGTAEYLFFNFKYLIK